MQRFTSPKTGHSSAKTRAETRLPHGMSRSVPLAGLTALFALAGCFRLPVSSCQTLCDPELADAACPGGLVCQPQPTKNYGLCATPDTVCMPPMSDAGRNDSGSSDADARTPLPPSMLCHNSSCLTLPDSVRSNLVLLLWPSNLLSVGSAVSVWSDQSGQGNDAHALDPGAPPHVIADGIRLDTTQLGTGLVVSNSPSLDFGAGDFVLITVAGLTSNMTPVSIARKSDNSRTDSRQISIDWMLATTSTALTIQLQGSIDDSHILATDGILFPSVAAYSLSRSADHAELHVNGTVFGSTDLPTGISTTNADSLYIGGAFGSSADSIEAVIAVRGPIESTFFNQLEIFLRTVFAGTAR